MTSRQSQNKDTIRLHFICKPHEIYNLILKVLILSLKTLKKIRLKIELDTHNHHSLTRSYNFEKVLKKRCNCVVKNKSKKKYKRRGANQPVGVKK